MSREIDSKLQPKKLGDDDRISRLPDDTIIAILSFLPPIEAARTSVLSSRWKNLWKITLSLKFDIHSCAVERKKLLSDVDRDRFVKWVNCVLQSHEAVTLKELIIRYDISGYDMTYHDEKTVSLDEISQWLEFAFCKKVQILELNFSPVYFEGLGYPSRVCAFPYKFLTKTPPKIVDFTALKALCFKFVDVSGEAIEFFLHKCPSLEQLIVHESREITNLEVCGSSSLALKHLELCYCNNLKCLKVSAPNLVSLKVMKFEELILEKVPMLVDVSIPWLYDENSGRNSLTALSCCISQLEILTLLVLENPKESIEFYDFSEMPRLKKLVVAYRSMKDEGLILPTYLIRASPYLQEFVLKLHSSCITTLKSTMKFPHEQLKVVKFCGYYGRCIDLELVRYFLEKCVNLAKLVIDPQPFFFREQIPSNKLVEVQNASRSRAEKQLEAEMPDHIELVIL